MNESEHKLYQQLLSKSQEAFVMAIELYNKPTIKYRVEGFAFFVCNAWELMLKAKLVSDKGESSIYYKDSDTRTLSLEKCIKLVFTNENDPLRKNLEKIIELRNTSTHYITEEYEMIYISLFQACTYNYVDKLLQFHNINVTDSVPAHFINLSISQMPINIEEIKAKYSPEVFSKIVKANETINNATVENSNNRFSILIKQDLQLVKSKDPKTPGFHIVKNGETADKEVMIVSKYKNVNETHPYTRKKLLEAVQGQFLRLGISLSINKSNLQDFIQYYGLKENDKFCYKNTIGTEPTYSYSPAAVDLIVSEVQKDINVFSNIHKLIRETENIQK